MTAEARGRRRRSTLVSGRAPATRERPEDAQEDAIAQAVRRVAPGARVVSRRLLGADDGEPDLTVKATGYGAPLLLELRDGTATRKLVLHTATSNAFGHDRRADRAAEMLLAYDTFGLVPGHARALDVGLFDERGGLISLRDAGEAYLLTEWVEGAPYAEHLRRIAAEGVALPEDVGRARDLARFLAALHGQRLDDPVAWRRSVRDLIGSGEGIFGIIDGYPADAPGAPRERLAAIEAKCASWRWRLGERSDRLSRIHGDFHPFNVIVGPRGELRWLDASRGCAGDPADDLTAMAVNFLFFSLSSPGSWQHGFAPLWHGFLREYVQATADREILEIAPPYLAWRALVVANPAWYPAVSAELRARLLTFVTEALDHGALEPRAAEALFEAR